MTKAPDNDGRGQAPGGGRGGDARIVSFVAAGSDSGKTTLIEKIVPLLKARGLRVAVIKHASSGFDLDRPGKDSWRFRRAGADAVIIAAPGAVALVRKVDGEPGVEELEGLAGDADVVIHEGFKKSAKNKIEVFRHGVSGERPLCSDDPTYLALASDRPFPLPLPQFDINDAEGLAAFIAERVRKPAPS